MNPVAISWLTVTVTAGIVVVVDPPGVEVVVGPGVVVDTVVVVGGCGTAKLDAACVLGAVVVVEVCAWAGEAPSDAVNPSATTRMRRISCGVTSAGRLSVIAFTVDLSTISQRTDSSSYVDFATKEWSFDLTR